MVADAARRAQVVTIVGTERLTAAGRQIVSVVLDADGTLIGEQAKTQIDPSEEREYVPGAGRRVFSAAGLTFGIAICHEAFRYPEISRIARPGGRRGDLRAPLRDDRRRLAAVAWCAASNPYNEKAVMLRALENTVYRRGRERGRPGPGLDHRDHLRRTAV